LAKAAVIKKWPSRFSTSSESKSFSMETGAGATRKPFGRDQGDKRDGDRHQDQSTGSGIAAWHLGKRVDRRRDGLRLARNVGDEGEGRSELQESTGTAEHKA